MSNPSKRVYTYEKPSRRNFTLTFLGFVGCMLLFLFIIFLAYLPNRPEPVDHAIVQERYERLAEMHAKEHEVMTSYGWVDQTKGIVHIPVERALELVLPELNKPQQQGVDKIVEENAGMEAVSTASSDVGNPVAASVAVVAKEGDGDGIVAEAPVASEADANDGDDNAAEASE